jgi:hypothetical protein
MNRPYQYPYGTQEPREYAVLLQPQPRRSWQPSDALEIIAQVVTVAGGTSEPRNPDSEYDPYADLCAGAIYDDGSYVKSGWQPVWTEAHYRQPYSVTVKLAASMHKALSAYARACERIDARSGTPTTAGGYLARSLEALGIGTVLVEMEHVGSTYSDNTYRRMTPGEAVAYVDRLYREHRAAA